MSRILSMIAMTREVLTDAELAILRFLDAHQNRPFTIPELTRDTKFNQEMAETIVSSLSSRGLIEVRTTMKEEETHEPEETQVLPSIDKDMDGIRELISRMSRLADKKSNTTATVFDRIQTRLNDEMSRAIANLEFSVDYTHDRLSTISKVIQTFREKIEENTLMAELGEISQEEAASKKSECLNNIRLEEQRKVMIIRSSQFENLGADQIDARTHKKVEKLKSDLEEIEARKLVGEFQGREGDFEEKKAKIVGEMDSLLRKRPSDESSLVEKAQDLVKTGRKLVNSHILVSEMFDRLNRACERLTEMASQELSLIESEK